ncbi:MAG: hypothetical protein Q4Q31_12020 [Bacillota bacterium]|nr:hypothetical protein [Bacillota bacterium]
MINKKLVLAALLAFSLTTSAFSTIVHAEETQVPDTNNQLNEEPTNLDEGSKETSITLITDKWTGENDIVLNVQAKKNTTIKLSEMYVWDDSASLGGIYVEPKIDLDENGNGTITFKNDDLKNVKTLIGSNEPLDWTKIKQIEMWFDFYLDEKEIYASKSAYVPVEISKTPAPVETENPKPTETIKQNPKTSTKNTQSKAVKTGDSSNSILYASLLGISIIVVGTIILNKKKSSFN